MAIFMIIAALIIGALENAKDEYDVQKWRSSGGMKSRYDCWKK